MNMESVMTGVRIFTFAVGLAIGLPGCTTVSVNFFQSRGFARAM